MSTTKNNTKIDVLRNDLTALKEALENGDKKTAREVADRIVLASMNEDGSINMKAALPYIVRFASQKVFKFHNITSSEYQKEVVEENVQTVFMWLYNGKLLRLNGNLISAIQNAITMDGGRIGDSAMVDNYGFTTGNVYLNKQGKGMFGHQPWMCDVVIGCDGEEVSIFDMEDTFDRKSIANINLGYGGEAYRSIEEKVIGSDPVILDEIADVVSNAISAECEKRNMRFQDFVDFCIDFSDRGDAQLKDYGDAKAIMKCLSDMLGRSKFFWGKIEKALINRDICSEYIANIGKVLCGSFFGESGSKQFIVACITKKYKKNL